MNHAVVLPIVVPLVAGAIALAVGVDRLGFHRFVAIVATAVQLVLAIVLLDTAGDGALTVYALGDWPLPFGIALVVDRLAAMMLVLTAVLASAAVLYSLGGWDRRGKHFHALVQFQLMGLNGAFLTGDLFNLFVFFEVLLIASYALLLHGRGAARSRAGIHYVVINLTGSALFLIAVALLYAVTGTLNMADLALRVAALAPAEAALARSAGLLLLVVFAIKAAVFPLYFWLPSTYRSAAAPVAALFAVMTKVGIYAIVRVYTLVFGADAGLVAALAAPWLLPAAVATAVAGSLGALAARDLRGVAAYLTIASIGTLLAALAVQGAAALGAALYYLAHSTLAGATLFLLAEPIARARGTAGDRLEPARPMAHPILLGTLLVIASASAAGLPPFAGFVGKLAILRATLDSPALVTVWLVVLGSGALALVALARAGSSLAWKTVDTPYPAIAARIGLRGVLPVIVLVGASVALAAGAGAAQRYTDAAARQLLDRRAFIEQALPSEAIATRATRALPEPRR